MLSSVVSVSARTKGVGGWGSGKVFVGPPHLCWGSGGAGGAGGAVPGRWKCWTLLRVELLPWRGVGWGALLGVRLSSHSRITCGQGGQ